MNDEERQYRHRNTIKNVSSKSKNNFLEIDANEDYTTPVFSNRK